MTNPVTFEDLLRLLVAWLILSILGFLFTRQVDNLSKPVIFGILFRLMLAWILLSILGFIFAKQIMTLFIPCTSWMIDLIQQDYSVTLSLTGQGGGQIQLLSTLVRRIPPLENGDTMNTSAKVMHFVIPLVLLYSLLIAWPVKCFQSRIKLLLLSSPLVFILVTLIMSFQLVAVNELTLQTLAGQHHFVREKPFFLALMHFIQNSGAWLRSIALAILGCAILPQTCLKPTE